MTTHDMTDNPTHMVETPSGKTAGTENFPVGSFLLPKALRPHVACFYNFARAIDDIADNPNLPAQDKISRLEACAQALVHGNEDPAFIKSHALGRSLEATEVTFQHGLDLISAFKQDAVQSRYATWDDLMDYCLRSAAPVGRYLLDLHGESPTLYPASDALCNALQVINHLQDASDDLRDMNRVYVPTDWLKAQGLTVEALRAPSTSAELRDVFNLMITGTEDLLDISRGLAPAMQNRHLRAETRIIQRLAEKLTQALAARDPLGERVKFSRPRMAWIALSALVRA